MQNSLQHVNSTLRTITTSSITTVQSTDKNQTRIWMHNMGSHDLESEMVTTPIDLRIEELQRPEAMKLYQNQDSYLIHKIKSYDLINSKQSSKPAEDTETTSHSDC